MSIRYNSPLKRSEDLESRKRSIRFYKDRDSSNSEELVSHKKDNTIHHYIEDSEISTDKLWSSDKINTELGTKTDNSDFVLHTGDASIHYTQEGISITESQISDFGTYQLISEKGQSNGYASLDEGSKVPLNQLPSTLLIYKGIWDADTNTPTLSEIDTSKAGHVYNTSVAGTQYGIEFNLGDWAIYNDAGELEKSDNSDDVVSVNGLQGYVVLDTDDITEGTTNLYYTDEKVDDRVNTLLVGGTNVTLSYDDVGNSLTINSSYANTAYTAGEGIDLSGTEFSHADTSTQGSVNNSNGTVVQDVSLDTYGHTIGLVSYDLDTRYYTETETDTLLGGKLDTIDGNVEIEGDVHLKGIVGEVFTKEITDNDLTFYPSSSQTKLQLRARRTIQYFGTYLGVRLDNLEQNMKEIKGTAYRYSSTNNGSQEVRLINSSGTIVKTFSSTDTGSEISAFHLIYDNIEGWVEVNN